jgi:hypothetical protein
MAYPPVAQNVPIAALIPDLASEQIKVSVVEIKIGEPQTLKDFVWRSAAIDFAQIQTSRSH